MIDLTVQVLEEFAAAQQYIPQATPHRQCGTLFRMAMDAHLTPSGEQWADFNAQVSAERAAARVPRLCCCGTEIPMRPQGGYPRCCHACAKRHRAERDRRRRRP